MKLSKLLSIISVTFFILGIIMIAVGWYFCLTLKPPAILDTLIGTFVAALGALLILTAFKIAQRVKKAKQK